MRAASSLSSSSSSKPLLPLHQPKIQMHFRRLHLLLPRRMHSRRRSLPNKTTQRASESPRRRLSRLVRQPEAPRLDPTPLDVIQSAMWVSSQNLKTVRGELSSLLSSSASNRNLTNVEVLGYSRVPGETWRYQVRPRMDERGIVLRVRTTAMKYYRVVDRWVILQLSEFLEMDGFMASDLTIRGTQQGLLPIRQAGRQ